MQFIKTVARLIIILSLPISGFSQSTYLPQGSQFEHFLDRIGIKLQTNPDMNIFTPKPISRKVAVQVSEEADSMNRGYSNDELLHLGKTDQENLNSLLLNNSEWVRGSQASFVSKHPIWNSIYKTKANFFEVNEKDFFLAVNPVLQFQISKNVFLKPMVSRPSMKSERFNWLLGTDRQPKNSASRRVLPAGRRQR